MMRIIQVCPAFFPVQRYGGTERVVYWLADALAQLGHQSMLLAKPGSYHLNPDVKVIECTNFSAKAIKKMLPPCVDILHFHDGGNTAQYFPEFNSLSTLHGNSPSLNLQAKGKCVVGVSQSHSQANQISRFVYNGVDHREFEYNETPKNEFLFFSKVSRKCKGVDQAINAAYRKKFKLNIAGGNRFYDMRKTPFSIVKSLIADVHFWGEIDGQLKTNLFKHSKALLFPIRWQEPFGLTMVEALLSGTPVIAYNRGSVPEIISEDVGFVVNHEEAFIEATDYIHTINRKHCRDYAMDKFDIKVAAKNYICCYEDVINGHSW